MDAPEEVRLSDAAVALIVVNEQQWENARVRLMGAMGERLALGLDVEYLASSELQPVENRVPHPAIENDDVRRRNVTRGRDPLLQLGAPGVAVLVRLCFFDALPKSLSALLDDRSITMLGVEILEDAQRLYAHWKLKVRRCLDLRHVCLSIPAFHEAYDKTKFSLKSIGAFLGQDIDDAHRDWRLACSNWAAPRLPFEKIDYAAKDALAAIGAYEQLLLRYAKRPSSVVAGSSEFWKHFHNRYRCLVNKPFNENVWERMQSRKHPERKVARCATVENMKPKQFRKLADAKHCSDSDVDFDFERERDQCYARMRRKEPPELVFLHAADSSTLHASAADDDSSDGAADAIYRAAAASPTAYDSDISSLLDSDSDSSSASGEAKRGRLERDARQNAGAVMVVEKELLDWCLAASVPELHLTVKGSVDGVKQRYGVTIEVLECLDES